MSDTAASRPTKEQLISLLWIAVMFNMVFADILTFITPGALGEILTGSAGGTVLTPEVLLAFALLLEIPMAMVVLSRVFSPRVNRWVNLVAALITTLFVIGGGSLTPSYVVFASVEVLCMGLITWLAWKAVR